jgi:hypothetical protein
MRAQQLATNPIASQARANKIMVARMVAYGLRRFTTNKAKILRAGDCPCFRCPTGP